MWPSPLHYLKKPPSEQEEPHVIKESCKGKSDQIQGESALLDEFGEKEPREGEVQDES
eukprot:GAFH01003550.1.p7 GENE.GAFH01003550.1~~GAFH01003550.1.p7  ORF type:complete len:58 (-),score=3.39 GAFH01003550.1:140-313(-)